LFERFNLQSITINNLFIRLGIFKDNISQSISINNQISRIEKSFRNLVQSITINLSEVSKYLSSRLLTQSITINNLASKLDSFNRYLNQIINVNLALSRFGAFKDNLSQNILISNSVLRLENAFRTLSQQLNLNSLMAEFSVRVKLLMQSVTTGNSLNRIFIGLRTSIQNINLGNIISRLDSFVRNLSQQINLDNAINFRTTTLFIQSVTQSINLNNLVSRMGIFSDFISQQISFSTPENGLLSHWKFDENSGNVASDSADSNNGVLINSPAWVAGKFNSGLQFNGVNQYVNISTAEPSNLDPGIGNWTFTAWVKTNNKTMNGIMYGRFNDSFSNGCDLRLLNDSASNTYGDFECDGFTSSTVVQINASLSPDVFDSNWHFITYMIENSCGNVFVDGINTTTNSGNNCGLSLNVNSSISNPATYIATDTGGSDRIFNGTIDEVRIYNKSLTPTEIFNLYDHNSLNALLNPFALRSQPFFKNLNQNINMNSNVFFQKAFGRLVALQINLNNLMHKIVTCVSGGPCGFGFQPSEVMAECYKLDDELTWCQSLSGKQYLILYVEDYGVWIDI